MENPQTRLIEAAVRPLSDDVELQLAAVQLLGAQVGADEFRAQQSIKRWEALDAKKRLPVWRTVLFVVLLVASVIVLNSTIHEIEKFRAFSESVSTIGTARASTETAFALSGEKTLTEAQRLILYGDEFQATRAGRAKGIWDRYPDNPAYFAQYAEACLSENGKLPDDFLENARKVAPDNAWFLYVAAGVEARDSVKKKRLSSMAKAAGEAPEWEILDAGRLEKAIRLIHEARTLKSCDDYKFFLMSEKIPLLAQGNKYEWIRSVAHLAGMTTSDVIATRRVGEVIAVQAGLLASEKDTDGFTELILDSDAFIQKSLSMEPITVVGGLVCWVNASMASEGLATGAKLLVLHPEAERYRTAYERLKVARESLKKREFQINGVEFGKKGGFLPSMVIPMVRRQVANPPVITDGDLKPGRLMEHEIVSMACALVSFLLLGMCLGVVWVSRTLRRSLIRRLAVRFESLLLPVDWVWVVGAGVILPVLLVLGINRFTPLGGRDFSVYGMKFFLPLAHFNALVLLLLIVPILVTRWRLGLRGGSFGFVWKNAWIGWMAAGSTLAYVALFGYAAPMERSGWLVAASAFHLVSYLWLIAVIARACFTKPARALLSATVAWVLVPAYACAMLLMICLVPIFKSQEEYWFQRDKFMSLDPKYPGLGTYEYKVAVQLQKETRAQLEGLGK